jgi:pimeloyl-ACP methyl ester carboxylesterase
MTKELDEILAAEKISAPYILVGHSLGCMLARYFYHFHKNKVQGMILIDPGHEDQWQEMQKFKSGSEVRYLDSLIHTIDPAWPKGFRDEIRFSEYNDGLMKTIDPPSIPVTVISSSFWNEQFENDYLMTKKDMEIKVTLVDDWVRSLPDGKHIVTDKSQHWIHISEPELISTEIEKILNRSRAQNHGSR